MGRFYRCDRCKQEIGNDGDIIRILSSYGIGGWFPKVELCGNCAEEISKILFEWWKYEQKTETSIQA